MLNYEGIDVIIYDFDHTVTHEHADSAYYLDNQDLFANDQDSRKDWAIVRNLPRADELAYVMEELHRFGKYQAFASHNDYLGPNNPRSGATLIKRYMDICIGEGQEIFAKERIQAYQSAEGNTKVPHIQAIIKAFNSTYPDRVINLETPEGQARILIVDDSETNLGRAQAKFPAIKILQPKVVLQERAGKRSITVNNNDWLDDFALGFGVDLKSAPKRERNYPRVVITQDSDNEDAPLLMRNKRDESEEATSKCCPGKCTLV